LLLVERSKKMVMCGHDERCHDFLCVFLDSLEFTHWVGGDSFGQGIVHIVH
jgi:hypothetical protein